MNKILLRLILATLLIFFLPFLVFSQNEESIITLSEEKEFSLTNLTTQLPYNNNLYLRLMVTSSTSATAFAYFETWNNSLDAMSDTQLEASIEYDETNIEQSIPGKQTEGHEQGNRLQLTISPNPVKDIATLDYYVNQKGLVRLELFDIYGSKINDLLNEEKDKGFYAFTLNVQNLTKGAYLCKLSVGVEQVSKMLIIE